MIRRNENGVEEGKTIMERLINDRWDTAIYLVISLISELYDRVRCKSVSRLMVYEVIEA